MAKFTQDMKDIVAKSDPFIVTTATSDGKPNGVPVGLVKVFSDDELVVVDVLMKKTRRNLEANPQIAVTAWDLDVHYGYQFKGKTRVETSGALFDREFKSMASHPGELKLKVKAVIIVKVEEVYYVGIGKDSSVNLWK
jgi:predicted pyridoxine 5'-phosphate oxidase superfamily flavin-nucleotide-binding protein